MNGVNKAIVAGYVGRDPEMRYSQAGNATCIFSIATTSVWRDKEGEKQERTEWHNIVMFGKLAELAGEYVKKGSPLYVEGRMQTSKYEKDGVTKYNTQVVANEMQFLGSKQDGAPGQGEAPAAVPKADKEFDDDIPF